MTDPRSSRAVPAPALVLGYAGLIPAILLIAGALLRPDKAAYLIPLAFIYSALVFSFIGGAWWGLAAHAASPPPGTWFAAVLPTILVLALSIALFLLPGALAPYPVAILGAAILFSPFVDGALVRSGLAPGWWQRLRWPLSIVLGLLTIALALISAR